MAAVIATSCGTDEPSTGTAPTTAASTAAPSTTTAPPTPGTEIVDAAPTTSSGAIPTTSPTESTQMEQSSTPDALGDTAAADLAARLAVSPGDIEVIAVEEVTWPDASLGCPQRDMQYQQVLTPGVRVILTHDGVEHRYHAGGGRDLFYCSTPQDALDDRTG